QDLLGEGERSSETLPPEGHPFRQSGVDTVYEFDRCGRGDGHGGTSLFRKFLRAPLKHTTMRQVRTIRYRDIAADLRRRIVEDRHGPGRLLPSESVLSRDYGASRVTVRKALEALCEEGLVASRQGVGWLVAEEPLQQRLAHLGTI